MGRHISIFLLKNACFFLHWERSQKNEEKRTRVGVALHWKNTSCSPPALFVCFVGRPNRVSMDEPGCFGIWKFSVVHPKELNYVPALFSSVPLPTLLNCDPRWRRKISTCRYSWSSPVPSLIVLLGNGAPRHFGSTNLPETRKKNVTSSAGHEVPTCPFQINDDFR